MKFAKTLTKKKRFNETKKLQRHDQKLKSNATLLETRAFGFAYWIIFYFSKHIGLKAETDILKSSMDVCFWKIFDGGDMTRVDKESLCRNGCNMFGIEGSVGN